MTPEQMISGQLTEGRAFRCDCTEPETTYHFMPIADMAEQIDRSRFVAHGNILQPGVAVLARLVELERFPPMTPRNDLLQLWNFRLGGAVWVAFSTPLEDQDYVSTMVKTMGIVLNPETPPLVVAGVAVPWPIPFGFHLTPQPGPGFYLLDGRRAEGGA